MVVSASYTDKGGNNIKALTGSNVVSLRSNNWTFSGNEKVNKFTTFKYNGANILIFPPTEGWFAIDSVDLSGVHSINLTAGWQTAPKTGFSFEVRIDQPGGTLLGKGDMAAPKKGQQFGVLHIPVQAVTDGNFHSIYFIYKAQETYSGGVVSVLFNGK